ncbi:DUF255 domain-containing protein [Sphingobacteriales bacterium UPWRP_1]|nr:hypothetical protein BVG80_09190 [Sphingobacteriales bacterium TSM_CSM]PSJ72910.1 DUF255 domain-containing protein [Sphingobacteriales bacterium UPWRP_1]
MYNYFKLAAMLVVCFMASSWAIQAQTAETQEQKGIQFFHGTWSEVKEEARKQSKPIFVDAYTTWCGPCKMMSANTFTDEKVGNFFNKFYVNYKIDVEKGEGRDFARTYRVDRYPTFLFINANGDELYRSLGYQQPAPFIMEGRKGLFDKKAMLAMQAEYKNGNRNADFMRNYVMLLWAGNQPEYNDVANEYLAALSPEDLKKNENIQFVFDFAVAMNAKPFELMLKNKDLFVQALGQKAVADKMVGVAFQSVSTAADKHDKNLFNQVVSVIKQSGSPNANEYVYMASLDYYEGTADWKNYVKNAIQYVNKFEVEDPNLLNNLAWNVQLHTGKKKELQKASDWVQKSISKAPAYYNYDTYAYILYKMGKKQEALTTANKAIEYAKQAKQDYSSTQKLIERIEK